MLVIRQTTNYVNYATRNSLLYLILLLPVGIGLMSISSMQTMMTAQKKLIANMLKII